MNAIERGGGNGGGDTALYGMGSGVEWGGGTVLYAKGKCAWREQENNDAFARALRKHTHVPRDSFSRQPKL